MSISLRTAIDRAAKSGNEVEIREYHQKVEFPGGVFFLKTFHDSKPIENFGDAIKELRGKRNYSIVSNTPEGLIVYGWCGEIVEGEKLYCCTKANQILVNDDRRSLNDIRKYLQQLIEANEINMKEGNDGTYKTVREAENDLAKYILRTYL